MENFSEDFLNDWERFKDKLSNKDLSNKNNDILDRTIFFVHFFEGDKSCTECIVGQRQLDIFLEKEFWSKELFRNTDLKQVMDDYNVWKLIPKSDFEQFPSLFGGATLTDLTINNEEQYMLLVEITIRQSVSITTEYN